MYIGFVAIGLLLIGLAGWYFFISRQAADLEGLEEARGFDIGVPSFSGSRGSTAENIASGFGFAPVTPTEGGEEGERPRAPRFWRVSTSPVAGAGFVNATATPITLRYVERSTGHIFDVDVETGEVSRRTNRLIPKVYEASIGPKDAIIARTVTEAGERETFVGQLATTTVDGFTPLTGVDLGPAVREIAFTQSGIVFTSKSTTGTQLIQAELDGSKPKELRIFGAGDFRLTHANGRTILSEKPQSGMSGYAYEAGTALTPLARAVPGLTIAVRAASSTATLIGSDDGSRLWLSVRATRDSTLMPLDIATVADKCVWMQGISLTAYCAVPKSTMPGFLTNWHRGTVHTADTWHLVDAGAGKTEKFFEMREDDAIDVEHPIADAGGNYLAFINARDKSLWLLRIIE